MHLHYSNLAQELSIRAEQVRAAAELLDRDNTVPFIARYRKEATAGLDEEQLRRIQSRLGQLRKLDARREAILDSIAGQGRLTPDLQARLAAAATLTELEDLYLPFRPKRRTRAGMAREKGLQGLADLILAQSTQYSGMRPAVQLFLKPEVPSIKDALAGARDIVAETIAEHPDVRRVTRQKILTWGSIHSEKVPESEDPRLVYESYYNFELRLDRLRPHQVLALNRGEREKVLRVRVLSAERDWRSAVEAYFPVRQNSIFARQLKQAAEDAAGRLLLPAIQRDVRRTLSEQAEAHAIGVFASNLKALLNQPPLAGFTVLGIDPGFRTGCKLAVVDPTGRVLETAAIYPHPPQERHAEARAALVELVGRCGVSLIAIGNGTASRETEQLVAELTAGRNGLQYLVVSEAGASVYSASTLARGELPDLDVSLRGAVSIARRVQDPLAELVKIDPRSIGVGLYQHDVDQAALSGALDSVVESVVNRVGVDVNTASPALLRYVAGVGPKLAERIHAHREAQGPFADRAGLMAVRGLGPKVFEQAAGFLRIRQGRQPLDASAIHPESYPVAEAVLGRAGLEAQAPLEERQRALRRLLEQISLPALAERLGTGVPTLEDIIEQLVRPGRDPRADLPAPILRSDVLSMDDLKTGMQLKGTVRNVVDFGAFVDLGVKHDGLLHRSQIPKGVRVQVGEVIEVRIRSVDSARGRIGLGWAGE
jgi:uncharacterized protein